MTPSSKILWGEGLFLRPQHFQRQDAYHEWRLAQVARMLHPYAWGVKHLRIDEDALQSGLLQLLELRAVLPDGDLYDAPRDDLLPPALSLNELDLQQSEFTFHLCVAPMRRMGSNHARLEEDTGVELRYRQDCDAQAGDWFTDAVPAEVVILRKAARLRGSHDLREDTVSLPLLRLRRKGTGGFEVDRRYIPPSLAIESAPPLQSLLRRLLDALQAKADALIGLHREPSKNVVEFRSGDVASFWLLHTVSAAHAFLSHLARHPGLHPERLYQGLLQLAGGLMTFSKSFTLADLPAYDHHEPSDCFAKMDHIVRELLEAVISTRYFAIALHESKPSFHVGRLDSEQIQASTAFFVGLSAGLPGSELIETAPLRLKIGAPDDVEKLVLSAMPGVRLVHAQQVPAAVPIRPGMHYFSLEARGPLYERMLQAQAIALYTPQGWPDLRLELIAVNP
ncbi:MAG: type VI secretion system baseplate subunit TssK [Caldimonas sp.]|uniref:type VI secretion system baseplate subunit TssK n=1 Tax=Caldimonas sp. TaxID=2838790 RepID=UPI00391BFF52